MGRCAPEAIVDEVSKNRAYSFSARGMAARGKHWCCAKNQGGFVGEGIPICSRAGLLLPMAIIPTKFYRPTALNGIAVPEGVTALPDYAFCALSPGHYHRVFAGSRRSAGS